MSEPTTVIEFRNVGKMYKIFGDRRDNLIDALGLTRFMPWRRDRYREFWALRGVDFELKQGQRLGIIGRNGAGKSTLLKLITENLTATEGEIRVTGDVQALLEIGGGLHPEFTGHENIQAALVHLGLSPREIERSAADIAEFTDLGSFLDQPFKTYSLGMQARLSFAIGTTVKPEILIIDEILGAGDAYFFAKSSARMQELIDSGAAVILVSHGLDQIVRFCDETIWIDRGRVAMRGPSVEVVKAYEKFIREFEGRRLVAKNRKSRIERFDAFEREGYTDFLDVRVETPAAGSLDVSEVALHVNGAREDAVMAGAPQDADNGQSAYVALDGEAWSAPAQEGERFFRTVAVGARASVIFNLWFYYPDAEYRIEVTYRGSGGTLEVGRSGRKPNTVELEPSPTWATTSVTISEVDEEWQWHGGGVRAELSDRRRAAAGVTDPSLTGEALGESGEAQTGRRDAPTQSGRISRWPGEGSILIRDVVFVDEGGQEQAVFRSGSPLTVLVSAVANESRKFQIQPVASLFRLDGILISNLIGEVVEVELEEADLVDFRLDVDELNLADGRYVVSIALYRELSPHGISVAYDLLDRSYEFEVDGNRPFDNGVFRHPSRWTMHALASDKTSSR